MIKRKMMFLGLLMLANLVPVFAEDTAKVNIAIVVASNQGADINLVNDDYRDEMIKLFSYSSYYQTDQLSVELKKAGREHLELPGGYELILTLQSLEKQRVLVQAIIRKDNKQYVDTVLSILKPGVVFVGGPAVTGLASTSPQGDFAVPDGGDLIIVLETGF